ncbi:hypothetical protein N0V88_005884 [Collariella sp. IMI 366227]|nr:hypothetical protein N0V88_005884 [Collariella sp. IMI 366227]
MASRSDTELLTEHFGYPPVSLLDEIINSINFLAERALHSIEQGLLNAPPASLGFRPSKSSSHNQKQQNESSTTPGDVPGAGVEGESEEELAARRHREEVEVGTHQLETLLWASIDKDFDRFEIYVMRNILGGKPTVESVNKLRRQLQASQKLNTMLVAERARNAALLGEMRRLVGSAQGIKAKKN